MNIRKLSIKANSTKSASDKRLMKNVVTNLATSLQDLTMNFRKNQNLYLKSINISILISLIQKISLIKQLMKRNSISQRTFKYVI